MAELVVKDTRKFSAEGDALVAIEPTPIPEPPVITATPFGKKVLVWRIPDEAKLVEVAEPFRDKPLECVIVAVPDGLPEHAPLVGDKVIIRKLSGTEIKIQGHPLTVVHVDDILVRL